MNGSSLVIDEKSTGAGVEIDDRTTRKIHLITEIRDCLFLNAVVWVWIVNWTHWRLF